MARLEHHRHEGVTTELRYDIDTRSGQEFLDEIVAPGIHIEVQDDDCIWAGLNGVFVYFSYKKGRAIQMTVPDGEVVKKMKEGVEQRMTTCLYCGISGTLHVCPVPLAARVFLDRQLTVQSQRIVTLQVELNQLERDRESERHKRIDAEADASSWEQQCEDARATVLRLGREKDAAEEALAALAKPPEPTHVDRMVFGGLKGIVGGEKIEMITSEEAGV